MVRITLHNDGRTATLHKGEDHQLNYYRELRQSNPLKVGFIYHTYNFFKGSSLRGKRLVFFLISKYLMYSIC